jgi:riboflavin kinase
MEILNLLVYLGKKGAIDRYITVTTPHMGSDLGISQQSVSRWLITLQRDGMIFRKEGIRGYLVQITPKGKGMLLEMRNDLNNVLAESGKMIMHGRVKSGMLDGKYYLRLSQYVVNIKSVLGFKPYPGTLNIQLSTPDDTQCKEKLCSMHGMEIPGFRKGERVFGSLRCFPCLVAGVKGAVVVPERSHYGFDVLEVISEHNLRHKLKLSDGDDVKVVVEAE